MGFFYICEINLIMNKQVIYAILTILLIPIGIFLIFINMTVGTPPPKHVPVKIVTDNVVYQQIAEAVTSDSGQVRLVSSDLKTHEDQKAFKHAEIIIADNHRDQLLVQRSKLKSHAKLLVASDVVSDQNGSNYWLSPEITTKTISKLSDLLSDFDPQNRDFYIHNSQNLLSHNRLLIEDINNLKSKSNVQFIATNNAQQIFMSQLNYKRKWLNIETATDNDFKKIEEDIRNKKINFILTAPQDQSDNDKRLIKLATDLKLPVVTFNQVLPSNQNILDWQFGLVEQLKKALEVTESDK